MKSGGSWDTDFYLPYSSVFDNFVFKKVYLLLLPDNFNQLFDHDKYKYLLPLLSNEFKKF